MNFGLFGIADIAGAILYYQLKKRDKLSFIFFWLSGIGLIFSLILLLAIAENTFPERYVLKLTSLFMTRLVLNSLMAGIFYSTNALFPPLLRGKAFQIVSICSKAACCLVQPFVDYYDNIIYAITGLSLISLIIMSSI